jgi:outer membrane protein assembly factor BamE (lipoprotein component of BamABCDE complex)
LKSDISPAFRRFSRSSGTAIAAILIGATFLAGCNAIPFPRAPRIGTISETSHHGYVLSPEALQQVPVGSSRDQVLIALGTPSTTAQYGGEVFYYISQTRKAAARFMKEKVVDQTVVAVYFNKQEKVEKIAQYGLKDGKVFDFVSRTTPTGGADLGFLQSVLSSGPSGRSILGGG